MKKVTTVFAIILAAAIFCTACGTTQLQDPASSVAPNSAASAASDSGSDSAALAEENPYSEIHFKVVYTNSTEPILTWNKFFCDELEKRSGGRYTIDRYLEGQMGLGDEDACAAVSEGGIEVLLSGEYVFSAVANDIIGVAGIPFAFKNKEHSLAFWKYYIDELNQRSREKYNLIAINTDVVGLEGARCLTANKAVRSLADMSGIKLRSSSNVVIMNAWKAIHGDVQTIPLADLYGALQTGVVNAQENPVEFINSYSFNEVQSHLMLTRHYYGIRNYVTGTKFWDSLNDADRELFKTVAEEALIGYNTATADIEEGLIENLKAKGMTVINPEEIQLSEFRDKAIAVLKGTDVWNQEVWDKIMELGENL